MATKYKYDKDTDYAALMEQAARRGDNAAAAVYEQQRNAKIRGEGMAGQEQTSDYAQYLPIEDVPDYDDTHRREAEALLTGRGTADRREQIDRMLDALLGEQFDYDPASDKLYAAYRQQYERQAELAAENALGKAAALTGGQASTAAVAASQQAGGYYRAMLAGKLPELAQLAYERNSKPALGHKWDSGTVTAEPTEKDPGTMTYTCTVCGATKTEVIPATGPHTHVWDEGTVTVAPTETTPGVRTYTCTVCGQTRTEIIPATGSAVCPGGAACPSFRFRDVPAPSNWAHEGIDYCVRHGLMSGFDATTFSPDTVSTRAQIVMILYNLSGDTTDYSKYYVPFTDVMPGTWYYNAVAWGYDKDIVSGMSATTFAPDGLITREQMAVLLYGYTEKYAPAYLGGAASLNGFPDAASVSNWAYAAMSWAVGNGLISGIASNGADYLAPSGGATRAQIAAIMMRYCRLTGL